ncbi:uncharacterized protein EV420DRAFT_132497 [Desarmillaria tabescens]|uniref:Uncharacterized protein n=1 Tax=Armillaria tabescens TaxID=1929756 RepID=A0AA39TPD9_ARMTA|nr:uncharacterized protein EV420DRAFT_132497 [Desarmillaria tabescens]KAK0461833.1 hypothetical protein EV420DRAFT_132497 [Desarmillaria tabescens]
MQAIDMNAISSVVSFLTDALIPFCSPITVQKIRFQLMTSLRSVQSLSLIPYVHPPRPIYNACLITGLPWAQWMLLLGNQPIHITITPLHVYAHVSTRMITLWQADADLSPTNIPSVARQRPLAKPKPCVRARLPICVPTLLDLSLPEAEADMDCDSDAESTASSSCFSSASDESMTSVSSKGSSKSRSKPYLPRQAPIPKRVVTTYLYNGGSTGVATGGVMLGPRATTKKPSPRVLLGPDDDDSWRHRV